MLRELRTLLAVVRCGTFATAGAQIGLTQSAVSAQIQRLEDELGAPLFERTGRSATLNAFGQRTVETAGELLAVYEKLRDPAGHAHATGPLRIGAIASAQTSFLVGAIERFRSASPHRPLRLVPGVSLNLLAQVDSGELEAAVIIEPPFALPPELSWTPLLDEPFVLLVPRRLATQPWKALLASEPFIRYDRHSFGGRAVERFLKRRRLAVHDVVEVDELQAMVGLVAQGVGVALVPRAYGLRIPRGAVGLPLGDDGFSRTIGWVTHRAGPAQPGLASFGDCIAQTIAAGPRGEQKP